MYKRQPDTYGLLTLGRPSVRCTSRSGPGVLCLAACFVSAKKATMAARGCRAYCFDLFRMRGATRQSAATSKTGFLVSCSSAAVQLQKKQSQSLRLYPYVSHRDVNINMLPAANLRGPPDKYGLLTLGRAPVRCTSRFGPGVLCSSACFVSAKKERWLSAKKATMAARGCRFFFFYLFRMRGAARQSAATSISGFLVNCSSAAVQPQEKQSQSV